MNWSDQTRKLAYAISKAEGFGTPGAIPTTANNPGDLTFAGGFPTQGFANAERVLKFVNLADGWQALYHQCDLMLSGKSHVYQLTDTLAGVAMKYANDPNWGVNVAAALGVPVTTTLAELNEVPEAT